MRTNTRPATMMMIRSKVLLQVAVPFFFNWAYCARIADSAEVVLPSEAFWDNEWPSDLRQVGDDTPLLEGTVLFAQSQIIPSKHGVEGDTNQPHLTALRKTLVMFKAHAPSSVGAIEMIVRDGDGNIFSDERILMNSPELIPKQDGWVDLGERFNIDDIVIPPSLDDPYVIEQRWNLEKFDNDKDAVELTIMMNEPISSIEIKSRSRHRINDLYLPHGEFVPHDSKIQITCTASNGVKVHIPKGDGSWRTKIVSKKRTPMVAILVNNVWINQDDLDRMGYVFGHGFHTATLDPKWVQPNMSLEFSTAEGGEERLVGILDDIDIGGVTELMITTFDAGFLTPPRNKFTFKDDQTTHREYYETIPVSRLVVVQYETMHFEEIMLPDGTLYTVVSADKGSVHKGDMRGYIGKILLSQGIDLANYGIHSSYSSGGRKSHPYTCALISAHNTVGMYQNGRISHGYSGGNGIVTLRKSVGNEFSHELGHNYGIGHYYGGLDGSVHRPSDEINSSWGWDSKANAFIPNFSPKKTAEDQCLGEQCVRPYLGEFRYGKDAMAGGRKHLYDINRYTLYTPYTSQKIQKFFEKKALWDPDSSTGFLKYNATTKQMEEFRNTDNGEKVPIKYRVPVTTIVGYYDPDLSRNLPSYIYPAMHGAYGFVYDDDDDGDDGDDNGDSANSGDRGGCKLVVDTNSSTALVYSLSTSVLDSSWMNKFHVNVATEHGPYKASIYCENEWLAERALDGPHEDLTYTVNGIPFDYDNVVPSPPTSAPTLRPTNPPTSKPTPQPNDCADVGEFEWRPGNLVNCQWVEDRLVRWSRFCNRKTKSSDGSKPKVKEFCPVTCESCPS